VVNEVIRHLAAAATGGYVSSTDDDTDDEEAQYGAYNETIRTYVASTPALPAICVMGIHDTPRNTWDRIFRDKYSGRFRSFSSIRNTDNTIV